MSFETDQYLVQPKQVKDRPDVRVSIVRETGSCVAAECGCMEVVGDY